MSTYKTETLADGFIFLEGPRWHEGRLWVSDMWDHTVFRIAEDGAREAVVKVENRPSGLGFLNDGAMLVVSMADHRLLRLDGDALTEYADLSSLVGGDVNDMVVDDQGRAYVGNFGYDLFNDAEPKMATLVRVDTDGSARVVADGLNFPNGSVIKDAGKTLVVAETFGRQLCAFTIGADGSLSDQRVYADLGEHTPDGICLDRDDGIWVASFMTGDFIRVLEGGAITDTIDVGDRRAVACQLGGSDGNTLFCLTYEGTIEEIASGKRAARIETVSVAVGGAGSP